MKVIAFVMMICLLVFSVIPGNVTTIHISAKVNCCHKMVKQSPSCNHKQNNDCGQGMCNTMLSCASCGFLKVDPIAVASVFPVLKELQLTPYHMGDLSGYSLLNWNPPKV